jgi:predicted DCC family thiol-disulfide oxidoreductase YuxK
LPTLLLDAGYSSIARLRYRAFGRYESCPMPAPEHRDLFLDAAARSIP